MNETELVEVDCDTYIGVYLDGKLCSYLERDEYTVAFMIDMFNSTDKPIKYAGIKFINDDWFDSVAYYLPENLDECVFYE